MSFDSKKYWNNRYQSGGTSGAGSYNKLAEFKAEIINDFILNYDIYSILDFGVGDGNQLQYINTINKKYIGIDISQHVISKCKEIYADDETKKFYNVNDSYNDLKSDLVISCDVIYHLIEDSIYEEYMDKLFLFSNRYVIIYAKDVDLNHTVHVKFRKFSNYIESNHPGWKLMRHIPNIYPQLVIGQNNDTTSPSDFYIYKKV